jgi:hypothetical protein
MVIIRAASAASEIFATLDTPLPDMSGLKDPDVSATDDIVFKDIYFAYPTRADTMVLNKLNVRFESGTNQVNQRQITAMQTPKYPLSLIVKRKRGTVLPQQMATIHQEYSLDQLI